MAELRLSAGDLLAIYTDGICGRLPARRSTSAGNVRGCLGRVSQLVSKPEGARKSSPRGRDGAPESRRPRQATEQCEGVGTSGHESLGSLSPSLRSVC
jgi:hypothetical protein